MDMYFKLDPSLKYEVERQLHSCPKKLVIDTSSRVLVNHDGGSDPVSQSACELLCQEIKGNVMEFHPHQHMGK
jgi:hypothetical protein